jgi:hypothetical protein
MPRDQTERTAAAAAMHRLLAGGWIAQIIHTTAELGLADHFGEEAQDVVSLAHATATNPPSLSRLLRALAAVGIVHETDALQAHVRRRVELVDGPRVLVKRGYMPRKQMVSHRGP